MGGGWGAWLSGDEYPVSLFPHDVTAVWCEQDICRFLGRGRGFHGSTSPKHYKSRFLLLMASGISCLIETKSFTLHLRYKSKGKVKKRRQEDIQKALDKELHLFR